MKGQEAHFPAILQHAFGTIAVKCLPDLYSAFEKVANENLSAFRKTTANHEFYGSMKLKVIKVE